MTHLAQLDEVWRFLDKIEKKADGCWHWTAAKDRGGYGHYSANGRGSGAHRFSYEYFVGPIPDGLHIDHTCRVRHCVNPDHLEAVTQAENNRRAQHARRIAALAWSEASFCQEHEFGRQEELRRHIIEAAA